MSKKRRVRKMETVTELKRQKISNTLDNNTILDMIIDPDRRKAVKKYHDNLEEDYGISFVDSMKSKMKLNPEE
ncbi:hypothetical protein PAE9249_05133 [Paenibacillus sp. CECT 9249]|uniref:hypothetical protein n=1 Tax=Paenibacillus sp. CECT 9249 TaxID=2845385 RepID=UPI001E39D8C5|nr:hypothetical protein [Paenibacillus sp. CECT 9249]CAH0122561.1 hypothetical protein PAE9249_05133 [Paenibacillus sp. CECT 9249]